MDNLKILNKSACDIFRALGMYDRGIPLLTFSHKCGNGSLRQCEQQLFKFKGSVKDSCSALAIMNWPMLGEQLKLNSLQTAKSKPL